MKYGKFELELSLFEEAPEVIRRIMSECLVINAHVLAHAEAVEYTASVEAFDEVEEGSAPPDYDIAFDAESDTVTWTRK